MSILSRLFGDAHEKYIASLLPLVREINAREEGFKGLSDNELQSVTRELKKRLEEGETLDIVLPDAFALAREAAKRTLNQRHFDVQLAGGIALHQGKIAEMKTGEGKTLVATLPLFLNSLIGKGAHLVTPNDYLSRVGAGWMGPLYHMLGVSVAVIAHEFSGMYDPKYQDAGEHADLRLSHFRSCTRGEAYSADITYGTNNEFGFDYLRDNLEYVPSSLRQREHHFAIVDEIDSILIDEARTPLIISAPDQESAELYTTFARITPQLKEGVDYNVDEKMRAVAITETGIDKVEKILNLGNIYEEKGIRFVHHLEQALRAQALFHKDKDYVVKDGEVIIVDEFTGRLMPGRRWSEGLHQAIEAKEGVKLQQESRTVATITFQNYFRMYEKLSGMTGTAETSAEEFHKVYNLDVVIVPTNRPMVREDMPDFVFRTEKGKFQAVVREVSMRHQKGQPVLIGTVSIEKNEKLSRMLQVEGILHEVLNAKNHEREALIIAQAGKKGAATVATNMAGRGVDIILGGSDAEDGSLVRGSGGLHVIGTARHEARRIDNQLRGRAGRQGDAGSSQFFVSLEDDLMRIFGSDKIKRMMESFGIPEDQPIENKMVSRAIESAQAKIEGFHFDSRKHILEYDDVLNKQRDTIYRMRKEILFSSGASSLRGGEADEAISEIAALPSVIRNDRQKNLRERIFEMLEWEITKLVEFHTTGSQKDWNTEEIAESVRAIAGAIPENVHVRLNDIRVQEDNAEKKQAEMVVYLLEILEKAYNEREKTIGGEGMRNIERAVLLRSIDMLWMDHLDQMEHLRDSVRLRAYGNRDPLVEYKHEGTRLFRELQTAIRAQVINTIFKIGAEPRQEKIQRVEERHPDFSDIRHSDGDAQRISINQSSRQMLGAKPSAFDKNAVGRNDPCPCGSGKKYKRCHGR